MSRSSTLATLGNVLLGLLAMHQGDAWAAADCTALLKAGVIEVRTEDRPVQWNRTRSKADLATQAGQAHRPYHSVLGLTIAAPNLTARIDFQSAEAGQGKVCVVPEIHLTLGLKQLDVYVAREVLGDCARRIVESHEEAHVTVWRQHIRAGGRLLEARLQSVFGQPVAYASLAEAKADVLRRFDVEIGESVQRLRQGIDAENAEIDTPLSYQRVESTLRACP